MYGHAAHAMGLTYVAMDSRTGTHDFVRLARVEELDVPVCGPSPDALNALLMARDPESLLLAVRGLGPMFRRRDDLRGLALAPSRAEGAKGSIFLPASAEGLMSECYFDPFARAADADAGTFVEVGRKKSAPARRIAEGYDFCSRAEDYSYGESRYRLVVEPVRDWVFLRNLLSVAMRLMGTLRRRRDGGALLTDAGFSSLADDALGEWPGVGSGAFVMPIGYGPLMIGGGPAADARPDPRLARPLLGRIARRGAGGARRPAAEFRNDPTIKLVAGREWEFLAIENPLGDPQTELADRLLRALDRSLYRPTVSFGPEPGREIRVDSLDLPSAAWGLLREHPGHFILTCEWCRRSVLKTFQGPNKRFCCDSCRVAWNKAHRRGEAVGY